MPRILVADEDEKVRDLIRQMLGGTDCEIEDALDGVDVIRKFLAHPSDLVVCNLFLPKKDGLEVTLELNNECKGVQIVVMSGGGNYVQSDLLPVARLLGASAVLYKPFQRAELVNLVHKLLGTDVRLGIRTRSHYRPNRHTTELATAR